MSSDLKTFLKTDFAIGAGVALLAIYQTQLQTEALFKIRTRYKWVLLMAFFAFYIAAGLFVVLRRDPPGSIWKAVQEKLSRLGGLRWVGPVLILMAFPIVWYARADFYGRGLPAFFRLMWLFWTLVLVQTAGWKLTTRLSWFTSFAFAVL